MIDLEIILKKRMNYMDLLFNMSDSFWGSLSGAAIAGIVAIMTVRSKFKYDQRVREIDKLDTFLKSIFTVITKAKGISKGLETLENGDYPQTIVDKEIIVQGTIKSAKELCQINHQDIIFEAFQDFIELKSITDQVQESLMNDKDEITDPRLDGLLDYSDQINIKAKALEVIYQQKLSRKDKISI